MQMFTSMNCVLKGEFLGTVVKYLWEKGMFLDKNSNSAIYSCSPGLNVITPVHQQEQEK